MGVSAYHAGSTPACCRNQHDPHRLAAVSWQTTVLERSLNESERAEVGRLVAKCAEHDAAKPLSDANLLAPSSTAAHVFVRGADSGDLWAYAVVDGPVAEGAVCPERRGRGIGGELVAAGRALGASQAWAHANLPAAQRLAAQFGAEPERRLLVMGLPAVDIDGTSPKLPAGFRLRSYLGSADDQPILNVNRDAFVDLPDQGSWTASDLAARIGAPWFSAEDLLLLSDDATGHIAGFHWTKIHPSGIGEIYVVALAPEYLGRGLGTLLVRAGLVHLLERGCPQVMLFVDASNTSARRVYDRLGFTVTREDILYRLTKAVSGRVST